MRPRMRSKQWHYPSARSMYDDLHICTTRHGANGRTVISIPKMPSSQITELTANHKIGPLNSTVPKIVETGQPI